MRLPDSFEAVLAAEAFASLPLTGDQDREVARLPWVHRDPFDRMLVAQARVSGLKLLTAGEIVSSYGAAVLLAR